MAWIVNTIQDRYRYLIYGLLALRKEEGPEAHNMLVATGNLSSGRSSPESWRPEKQRNDWWVVRLVTGYPPLARNAITAKRLKAYCKPKPFVCFFAGLVVYHACIVSNNRSCHHHLPKRQRTIFRRAGGADASTDVCLDTEATSHSFTCNQSNQKCTIRFQPYWPCRVLSLPKHGKTATAHPTGSEVFVTCHVHVQYLRKRQPRMDAGVTSLTALSLFLCTPR